MTYEQLLALDVGSVFSYPAVGQHFVVLDVRSATYRPYDCMFLLVRRAGAGPITMPFARDAFKLNHYSLELISL